MTSSLKRGVVLMNVGTPDDTSVPAVRRYLAEFLSDPKVLEMPAIARWSLLNFIILPFRPSKSAHAYQQIWTEQGSPLLLHTRAQAEALQAVLPDHVVTFAMRYGNPSLGEALKSLQSRGVEQITLVPMYPQYARASTGTTVEHFEKSLAKLPTPPVASVVPEFYGNAGYIEAVSERVRETVKAIDAEFVLFSYHGLPVSQHTGVCTVGCVKTDQPCTPIGTQNAHCYRGQAYATTNAIVAATGIEKYTTAFQSRLKGQKWIRPFTDEVVVQLAQQGVKRLAIACPSFVADCLETLEEIGMRAKESFIAAGGQTLALVPAVNDSPTFIRALAADVVRGHIPAP